MNRITYALKAFDMPAIINTQLNITAMSAFAIHRGKLGDDQANATLCALFVEADHVFIGAAVPFSHMDAHGSHNHTVAQFQLSDLSSFE